MSISASGFVLFLISFAFMHYNRVLICKIITLFTGYLMITGLMIFVFNSTYKLHFQFFFHLIYLFTIFEFRKGKTERMFIAYFVMICATFSLIEFGRFNEGVDVFPPDLKAPFILSVSTPDYF